MQQGMANSLTPYVTSSFEEHSLTATTSILSSIIGGLFKLPLAKILDIWGRTQGFVLSMFFLTIGLIMMAGCNNVETYAAAQVFYWVGLVLVPACERSTQSLTQLFRYNGMSYSLSIFIADTSALKNRGLMFAFISSPYIVTTWLSGPIASSFLYGAGFRWGFGTFAIVTPVMSVPLFGLFIWNYRKAKGMGLMPARQSSRTFWQSCKYYFIEFDIIGLLLISGGLALFLLPFSIYSYQTQKWQAPIIIGMLIFGSLLLIAFALYEKYVAPVKFIPFELLFDRTIMSSMILACVLFISFYLWDSYFGSFLQVVNHLTLTEATYVSNIYSIGSCFFGLVVGVLIRWTGRFKWLALYFGMPLSILGVGLMILFRQPDVNIGYIVMCQVFIAFAGGALVICEQMAVMASVTHQHIAVILAIEAMFSSVGGAIGSTIAAAIWTGVFPESLAKYLPPESQGNLTQIYGDLTTQLSYPVGSPTRNAIEQSYGDAQKAMLIASTALLAIGVVCCALWRDIKVKEFKQVKGLVD